MAGKEDLGIIIGQISVKRVIKSLDDGLGAKI